MALSILDLFIWAAVIWFVWKTIKGKMGISVNNAKHLSGTGVPLTDTQIHFREQMAIVKKEQEEKDSLLEDKFTTEQQRLIKISLYIQKYKRPFRFYEWLTNSVDSRLMLNYIVNLVAIVFGLIVFPIYQGWPIMTYAIGAFVVFYDLLIYRKQRILEVTEWNPDFQKKFGK